MYVCIHTLTHTLIRTYARICSQHYITMFGGTISVPLILAPSLCIPQDSLAFGELISTFFFVGGVATLLQNVLGSR